MRGAGWWCGRVLGCAIAIALLLPLSGCIAVRMDSPPPWLGARASTETAQPASSRPETSTPLFAYFVKGGHLVAVPRSGTPAKTAPEDALRVLLAGPTAAERKTGVTSAIPSGTRLNSVDVDFYKTARVDLSLEFAKGGTSAPAQDRVAQVVYTLTQLPGITGVQFTFGGKKAQFLGSERIDMLEPKTRADLPVPTAP